MRVIQKNRVAPFLLAMAIMPVSASVSAQDAASSDPNIIVNAAVPVAGPELKGVITARSGDRMQVTAEDGTSTIVAVNEATQVKAGGGLFGGSSKLTVAALLNGLPVTVKTLQSDTGLIASQVTFRKNDFKTANMIRNGTAQGFAEQTAATEALRGRMGDIDKYNVKATTNVYFDTGKAVLSPGAKADLCALIVSVDRMERGTGDKTTLDELREAHGMAVYPIVTVREVISFLHNNSVDGKVYIDDEMKGRMEGYLKEYGAK